jgi:hypothetical protein
MTFPDEMELRDWFAMQVVPLIVAGGETDFGKVARMAYTFANRMIATRKLPSIDDSDDACNVEKGKT